MTVISEEQLENILSQAWARQNDPAHDLGHVRRVVKMAKDIAEKEGASLDVVIPAAWLHDCVCLPKNHPDRSKASVMAADYAVERLAKFDVSEDLLKAIHHAISAHSFSANITATTIEAKALQDADRLDALGAIGIARCFAVNGALGRVLFDPDDPAAESRELDDTKFGLDHFYVKLFKIAETLHTDAAKNIAQSRVNFMKVFVEQVKNEV